MGIFGKLFENKKDTKKSEVSNEINHIEKTLNNKTEEEIVKMINIDASETLEKFHHHTKEVLDLLMGRLIELHKLEQEIFDRSQKLKDPNEPNQVQPGENELWEEYRYRRKLITASICLNPHEGRSYMFGKPTKYEYLTYPETKISFIMKSVNRAVVEAQYEYGIKKKEQFVFTKEDESWKLVTKKYGFQNEAKWHKDEF